MAGKRWTQKWHQDQITSFKAQRTAYEVYALLLNKVLERVCRRHTQYGRAEARAKSVTSFAEKAIRKFDKYDDPIHMFTDLCGGRTVTFTQTEADRVCTFVRANFIVDEDNSEDVRKRLKPDQFGYRRGAGRLRIKKETCPLPLEEGDSPAVGMDIRAATACLEAGEGKADVGRHIAVHAEQLAHGGLVG